MLSSQSKMLSFLDISDRNGNTLLHKNVKEENLEQVKKLVQQGLDPNYMNDQGETPLSLAIDLSAKANSKNSQFIVVQLLKSKRLVSDPVGKALLVIAEQGDVELMEIILKKIQADVTAKPESILNSWRDKKDRTVLDIAIENENQAMMTLLEKYGALPSIKKDPALDDDFRGRHAGNYQKYLQYVVAKDIPLKDLDTLGLVSEKDDYYFEETEEAIEAGIEFLNAFWKKKENIELTLAYQKDTYEQKKEKLPGKSAQPSCLSFIPVEINGKEYCLVASSISKTHEFFSHLNNFVDAYNKKLGKARYVLLSGKSHNFSQMMMQMVKDVNSKKGCAEKYLLKFLVKILLQNNKVYVKGMVNFAFYPYYLNGSYSHNAVSAYQAVRNDPYVAPPFLVDGYVELNQQRIAPTLNCCPQCQKNKPAAFKMLKTAEIYGKTKPKNSNDVLELSPVRNSFISQFFLDSQSAVENNNDQPSSGLTSTI